MSNLLEQASLVMIPSGYKEDVVYSEIPLDGSGDLSFTRSSDGTRINSQGFVETVPWNLLEYSNNFSNGVWLTSSTSVTSGQSGYDGTSNAWLLTSSSSNGFIYQNNTINGVNTFTSYCKAGTNTQIILYSQHASQGKYFDLSLGTVGANFVAAPISASIESVGNGWYRCSLVVTASTNAGWRIYNVASGTTYIQNTQCNIGSTAKPYFPTTDRLNVPRLTYQNGGGGCPSLLLEPQRTNLLTWSDDFSNAAWSKDRIVVTANATTSPDGTQNADKIADTLNGNNTYRIFNSTTLSAISYTQTFYAKAAEYNWCYVRIGNASRAWFNVGTGVVGTVDSGLTASIQSVGDGWYRIITTITTATAGSGFGLIALTTGNGVESYTPTTGGMGIYVYGAQLEAGAYPTSYIPTTSASATRVADAFTRNNIYTNGLITSSGGTWFVELKDNIDLIRNGSAGGIFINTGTLSLDGNGFLLRNPTSSSQKISIIKYIAGVATTLYNTLTTELKVAIKWNGTTADVFVNGTKVVSATAFTTTAMENLIGEGTNRSLNIAQIDLFPTPLTDAQCQELTTL
jgi:hypothetical protein